MSLDDLLGSPARIRVIRALFEADGESGRKISARAGVSPSAGKAALDDLAAAGLVLRARGGHRHRYEVNRNHLFAHSLEALFAAEREFFNKIAEKIAPHLDPGNGASLLALGINQDRGVTILVPSPKTISRKTSRVINQTLWFSFGLHLAQITANTDAVRPQDLVWAAGHDTSMNGREDGKRLVDFFQLRG